MDYDLMLVIGIFVGILAIPSLLAAFSDSRSPRAGAIMILIAGTLVAVALSKKTGGYTFDQIPEVVMRVIKRYLG